MCLSVGRIREAGAHSPGLRRIMRSEKDLEKDGGSDDKRFQKKKKKRVKDERDARVCNIHQTPKI